MKVRFALLLVALVCACEEPPAPVTAATKPRAAGQTGSDDSPRGASTPEERAAAVEASKRLEAEPLGPSADEERGRMTVWVMQVPDIVVKTCAALLGDLEEGPVRSVLFGQMLIASAAFIIEHPDKAKDDKAVFTAGLESAVRAYAAMLKEDPSVRTTFLDDLLGRQRQGKLAAYVREADCGR